MKNIFLAVTLLLTAVITITGCTKWVDRVQITKAEGTIIGNGDPVIIAPDLVLVTFEIDDGAGKKRYVRALTSQKYWLPCPECVTNQSTNVINYTITDSMGVHSYWVIQPSFDNSRMTPEEYTKFLKNQRP
ncbi:MAG: hypothetical protein NTX00_04345 [Candidatus Parcubacteria bacterium]|nr:hypothetical protein [Candidatus Parcubacteria bacterium]